MKSFCRFAAVILVLGLTGLSHGQEYSYKFTPFGLTAPFLEQGEYALYLRSNYNKSEYDYSRGDSTYSSDTRDKDDYIDFDISATYAFTERFFIRGYITYRPPQKTSQYDYFYESIYGSTIRKEETETNGYFSPYLNFIFKPTPYSEIVASYSYTGWTEEVSSIVDAPPYRLGTRESDSHRISMAFYMIGKL